MPERVFLIRNGEIKAMASYNRKSFADHSCLIVEGICLDPSIQGRGIFREITDQAMNGEDVICLRTQNPRMYKALANYCTNTFPGLKSMPQQVRNLQEEFATYLKCDIDDKGVVKGYYGGLFYGKEPEHSSVGRFFKQDLGMNLNKGDAVLAIGLRDPFLGEVQKMTFEESSMHGPYCCL